MRVSQYVKMTSDLCFNQHYEINNIYYRYLFKFLNAIARLCILISWKRLKSNLRPLWYEMRSFFFPNCLLYYTRDISDKCQKPSCLIGLWRNDFCAKTSCNRKTLDIFSSFFFFFFFFFLSFFPFASFMALTNCILCRVISLKDRSLLVRGAF